MIKYIRLIILLLICNQEVKAQNLWNRLKQKAEETVEKAIDKKVDDLLDGKPEKSAKPEQVPSHQLPPPISKPQPDPTLPAESGSTTAVDNMIHTDTIYAGLDTIYRFNTSTVTPKEFVSYALTLKGTPYSYGSTDPAYGLDCSGFITHVFNKFNIQVPRRAFDFKNAEKKVPVSQAKPGDLILFSGSDNLSKIPGHMGIVISKPGQPIEFIHASSGKANAVTTSLITNPYYKTRILEAVRVF